MNITPSNIRSVVLQALLLIFLAILRTKADEIEEPSQFHVVKLDYFHNVPNLDPIHIASTNTFDEGDNYATTTDMATLAKTEETTIEETTSFVRPTMLEPKAATTTSTTTTIKTATTQTTTTTTTTTKKTTTTTTESTATSKIKHTTTAFKPLAMSMLTETWTESITDLATESATDSSTESTANPTTEETLESENDSPSTSLDITSPSYIVPTMTLPLSILTSITTSSTASTSSPSIYLNTTASNTTTQYTNTSDPLVQYDLECRANDEFCIKVSRAVGAAIDEFTRVINVKINLL